MTKEVISKKYQVKLKKGNNASMCKMWTSV